MNQIVKLTFVTISLLQVISCSFNSNNGIFPKDYQPLEKFEFDDFVISLPMYGKKVSHMDFDTDTEKRRNIYGRIIYEEYVGGSLGYIDFSVINIIKKSPKKKEIDSIEMSIDTVNTKVDNEKEFSIYRTININSKHWDHFYSLVYSTRFPSSDVLEKRVQFDDSLFVNIKKSIQLK